MASQQAYPSYGSSSTSQQSYPVPRPTTAAPNITAVAPSDPVAVYPAAVIEVNVPGVMTIDITNPVAVE